MSGMIGASGFAPDATLERAARIAVDSSLKLREGESFLIVTNPERDVLEIACSLYDAAIAAGAKPTLVIQPTKAQTDYAEKSVIGAFESRPDAFASLSAQKLGKDREGIRTPYDWDGVKYDHIFHYQLYGARTVRAFWSPGLTREMFAKTVPIDYALLKARCAALSEALAGALYARVTNAAGTDMRVGLRGRAPKADDGDFSHPGSGGNLPAGEVFVSPELGASEGMIAFDRSIAAIAGDILIREPIRVRVEGGEEATRVDLPGPAQVQRDFEQIVVRDERWLQPATRLANWHADLPTSHLAEPSNDGPRVRGSQTNVPPSSGRIVCAHSTAVAPGWMTELST